MSEDQQRHRVLGGPSRSRLLAILAKSGHWMSVQELAAQAGPRPNTTREHLDQLVEAGLVERERSVPKGRGRPAFRYRAKRLIDEATAYRALAEVLADAVAQRLDAAAEATSAGERWGKALVEPIDSARPVDQLVQLFDEMGFDPSLTAADSVIELRACPFRPLALTRGNVVCSVHLGLMRGALDRLDAHMDAVDLEPFVAPNLCLAHLDSAGNVG